MRIGYVLRSLEDSGVTVYVLRLADAMRRRGHDVFLVSDGGTYESEVQRLGLRWLPLELCRNPLSSYLAARRLGRLVRSLRPDILHANWRRAQLACHLAQRDAGIPFVSTLHLVGIPDNWFYRRLTHWGALAIAPCTEAVDYLRDAFGVPQERIRLIFHGVDPADWPVPTRQDRLAARQALGLPSQAAVLVCVARLEKIKGHDLLLRAFAEARRKGGDLRLLLVGAGREEGRLKRLATELQLGEAARFLGYTDPHQALAAADAFVLASWRESFGIAPAEAMLSGLPLIRTDSEGARDQIVPGETGAVVPRGEVETLARAVADVACRRDEWLRRGELARRRALDLFTLDRMAERVERAYLEVLCP